MALISWWAMVGKLLYLRRVARANQRFRIVYRKALSVAGDKGHTGLTGLGSTADATLRGSPLYRLYQVGSQELNERLDGGVTQADGLLAPQSIAAIRAAVDACVVRENQRLNRTMVLLTIAISGGPFLGLLGTVVGVMITFAAIAQAGDVNVNAIAPGIAAALVATVAGLVVAIPALFGYNYLISRIKDLTTDMQVFVDEFVTKMAEYYSDDRAEHNVAAE
jgi:biopolymer transport protein ExbB